MDKFVVRDATGSVDVNASAAAYAVALTKWVAENEVPTDRIQAAVSAVFDRFPGQRLTMPALLSLAVVELGASPAEHKVMTDRVHAFVRASATGENATLVIAKGKGGGVSLKQAPAAEPAAE